METSIENSGRTMGMVANSFSILLERSGYYGLRGILTLYMVSESLSLELDTTFRLYGFFIAIVALTPIIGSVIGDLLSLHRWSCFIGNTLQAVGAFVLCFDTYFSLIAGLGIIALGSGLYKPNMLARIGKLYLSNTNILDSIFSVYMIAVNVGAFFGLVLIALIAEKVGYQASFAVIGLLLLISGVAALLSKDKSKVNSWENTNYPLEIEIRALLIISAMIGSGLFWVAYEIEWNNLTIDANELFKDHSLPISYTSISAYMVIPVLMVLAIIWYSKYYSHLAKFVIAFICAILGVLLSILAITSGMFNLGMFLLICLLFAVAEAHITPVLFSLVTKYLHWRYLSMGMAATGVIAYGMSQALRYLPYHTLEGHFQLYLAIAILITGLVGFVVLYFVVRDKKSESCDLPLS